MLFQWICKPSQHQKSLEVALELPPKLKKSEMRMYTSHTSEQVTTSTQAASVAHWVKQRVGARKLYKPLCRSLCTSPKLKGSVSSPWPEPEVILRF
jgi:hypothetical protein